MSGQPYLCSNCSHRFTLEAAAERRCPNCLRATGIAPDAGRSAASSGDSPKGGPMKWVAAVLILASTGFAAWYFLRSPAPATPDPTAKDGTTAKAKPEGADISTVPAPLNVRLDTVSEALRALVAKWPSTPEALVAEVAQKVPNRSKNMDFEPEAPNGAADLASGKAGLYAGSLERASLVGGLLKAGGKAVEYGYNPDEYQAMTAVLSRRYLVRVTGGTWLDPEKGAVFKGSVTPLSDAEVLANTLALRAMVLVDHQQGDEASKAIGHARRLAPKDPAIRFAYGEVQVFNELADMGISAMEVVATTHADAMTWTTLGEYASEARLLFKAQQYFQKAAKADPKFAKPHALMAQLALERLAVTPPDQHPTLLKQVEEHVKNAEGVDPKAEGIRTIRAQLALFGGKGDEAEPLMKEEVALHPKSRNAALTLAQFYIQQRNLPEATTVLQAALTRGIKSYELHMLLGGMLNYQQDIDGGLKHFNLALALAPHDQRLRPQLAQAYVMKGDVERALTLLNEQATRFPKDTDSKLLLVQLMVREKKWAVATTQLEALAKELTEDPTVAILRYLVALGTKKGIPEFQAAAIKAAKLHSNLAQILVEQGMLPQAEALLIEAVNKAPTDEQAPYLLVAMMAAQGRAKEAQAVVDKVVARTDKESVDKVKEQFKSMLNQGKALPGALPDVPDVQMTP